MATKARGHCSPAYLTTLTRKEWLPPWPLEKKIISALSWTEACDDCQEEVLEGAAAEIERPGELAGVRAHAVGPGRRHTTWSGAADSRPSAMACTISVSVEHGRWSRVARYGRR